MPVQIAQAFQRLLLSVATDISLYEGDEELEVYLPTSLLEGGGLRRGRKELQRGDIIPSPSEPLHR